MVLTQPLDDTRTNEQKRNELNEIVEIWCFCDIDKADPGNRRSVQQKGKKPNPNSKDSRENRVPSIMASNPRTRREVFEFDNNVFEAEDELLDMTMVGKLHKHQDRRSRWLPRENKSEAAVTVTSAATDDDEDRVPPPIEEVSSSASNHPDFASWKRDMAGALLDEAVSPSSSSSSSSSPPSPPTSRNKSQLADWKTARINKRREKKLKLQEQLRSVKSDTSIDVSNESGSNWFCSEKIDDYSMETQSPSSRLKERPDYNNENRNAQPSKSRSNQSTKTTKSTFEPFLNNIYVRREKVGMARRRHEQSPMGSPSSPRSKALDRPTQPALSPTISPRKQHNSMELAAIMKELVELKMWATKSNSPTTSESSPGAIPNTTTTNSRPRQSTPPSSPTSPAPPASRDEPEPWTELDSLEVPSLVLPPSLSKTDNTKGKKKKRRDKGLIVYTASDGVAAGTKSQAKTKKAVRFTSPEITNTVYRPKTPREDIINLFFQEDELLDWEYDEATTLRDRFEVIVTEVDDSGESSPRDNQENSLARGSILNIGTPVISFHNSFSCSFQESDDDASQNEKFIYEL
eukprot:jgi/Psemu1/69737/estExt_Genemark1.C_10170004